MVSLWCGQTVGRTGTWLPNFLGWVDYHMSLAMGLCPRTHFTCRWSLAISLNFYLCRTLCRICHHSFLALGFTDASCISWRYFYEPCCPKHGNRVLTKAAKNFLFLVKDRHLKKQKNKLFWSFPFFNESCVTCYLMEIYQTLSHFHSFLLHCKKSLHKQR